MASLVIVLLLALSNSAGAEAQSCTKLCAAGGLSREGADCISTVELNGETGGNRYFRCPTQAIRHPDGAPVSSIELVRLDVDNSKSNRFKDPPKSDLEHVIARYSETIMLNPEDDDAYFRRGIANFYSGFVSKALADVGRASELDPNYPYYPLWLHLIGKRANQATHLAETIAHIDTTAWPAPIIRLFLGQATPEAVLAAAANPDAETQRGQVCEANFYIGQLALQHNATEQALRLFRLAASDCPRDFVEGPAAGAELTALDRPH